MSMEDIEKFSGQLSKNFLSLPEYQATDTLFAYISFNQEVRTRSIIEKALSDGKKVAVPRVEENDIEFRYINSFEECSEGTYGINEPDHSNKRAVPGDKPVLMLMPGLAFDSKGIRVGYGKGLYDRYLSHYGAGNFLRIALCYDFQLLDHIDSDRFDIPAHRIICAPSGRIINI